MDFPPIKRASTSVQEQLLTQMTIMPLLLQEKHLLDCPCHLGGSQLSNSLMPFSSRFHRRIQHNEIYLGFVWSFDFSFSGTLFFEVICYHAIMS